MNNTLRIKRHNKLRYTVIGTAERPRLSIYRGNRHLYAQLIDDAAGKTIVGLSDKKISTATNGMQRAETLAIELAKIMIEKKITTIVFDRGGFGYHGQIAKLAETLRANGIQF